MGDGVTSDSELEIKIEDASAGTTEGMLILDDVEFRKQRDNDPKHGVGNDEPQGMQYGNITYNVSATAHLNGASADLAVSVKRDAESGEHPILTAVLRTPNLEVDVGKLDWNDVRIEASDGGDVTMAADFDARQYEERSQ